MRDYWLTQYILAAVGWGYLLVSVAAIALALWLPKGKRAKAVAALIVVAVASILPLQGYQGYQKQNEAAVSHRARQAEAQALFAERCKTAGEKIYKTVENVEGVLLLNVRDSDIAGNRANPLWSDAALPDEAGGDEYIRTFLYWEHDSGRAARGFLNPDPKNAKAPGYRYVDVKQPNGAVNRYRLVQAGSPELRSEPVTGQPARYAVGFTNRVDPEDRKHWVAGTTITVTDTRTNEIIAQRESYSFEPGLGNTDGFRSPWGFAVTCPSLLGWHERYPTRLFVDQILKPTRVD